MNRTIKFRAWDNVDRKFEYVELLPNGRMGLPEWKRGLKYWQQFTGLLDENGKEIYEGDVFNCIYHRDGHTDHRYYIIYDDINGRFGLQRIGPPCSQREVSQSIRDVAYYGIIGNIYKNPDLLK